MTRRPIASSIYRLADSDVLIGVATTLAGPTPLFTDVEGEIACVAYTDESEARADLPQTHELFSIEVTELLRQLPSHVGLVIDPRAPAPVYLPADGKQGVLDAGGAFPAGVQIAIGEPAQQPTALMAAIAAAGPGLPGLRRVWRTWYQVADAGEKLLVVYDVTGGPDEHTAAADLVVAAAEATDYPHRLLVLALEDVPASHREYLLDSTPASYERQA